MAAPSTISWRELTRADLVEGELLSSGGFSLIVAGKLLAGRAATAPAAAPAAAELSAAPNVAIKYLLESAPPGSDAYKAFVSELYAHAKVTSLVAAAAGRAAGSGSGSGSGSGAPGVAGTAAMETAAAAGASMMYDGCIVPLLGASLSPPRPFMVFPAATTSLHAVLHPPHPSTDGAPGAVSAPSIIPLKRRMQWAMDIANALVICHAAGIIHRDIKPANILLMPSDAHLRLTDFGLAGATDVDAGTPAYMAPELLAHKPFNKSVDTYAYGVLLWEVFTRALPFAGWRTTDLVQHVISGGRPDAAKLPAILPPRLVRLVTQCWAHAPAERPSMAHVLCELMSIDAEAAAAAAARSSAAPAGGDAISSLASTLQARR